MHQTIQPKILYYGFPVLLLSTLNEDHTTNISPLSSSWTLGNFIVLGISESGKAVRNLREHPECVINLPSPSLWEKVEGLGSLTGLSPVPDRKKQMGYQYVKDKFAASGFSPIDSQEVKPSRISECPIQIEAVVRDIRTPDYAGFFAVVEVEAVRVHAHPELVERENYINPKSWSPLIYNFRHYFSLGEEMGYSELSETKKLEGGRDRE